MNEFEFDHYIDKFPIRFRNYLEKEKHRKRFFKSVKFEYKDITVYRAVHCCKKLHDNDFLNNIEEKEYFFHKAEPNETLNNFAISVNESKEMLKSQIKYPNKKRHLFGIAIGKMKVQYGPADFDEDRPHHNWYLFEGISKILPDEFNLEEYNV